MSADAVSPGGLRLDLGAADLRRELPLVRAELVRLAQAGEPVAASVRLIAQREPVALVELLVGPRAVSEPAVVRAALGEVAVLEEAVAPKSLYRRLGELNPVTGPDVLAVAISRHPDAPWLIGLAQKLEGADFGRAPLRALADHPDFAARCVAYAEAGARASLVVLAGELGRIEPLEALFAVDALAEAQQAALAVLRAHPEQPVVAWLAALYGPEVDRLVERLIPALREAAAVRALHRQSADLPRSSRKLAALARALPA